MHVCACAHTHAHTTPHSLHCNTVRRQLSKESLPGSVNLPYCGSSCPTPIYQVSALQGISVRHLHSHSTLLPSRKDVPHTLPPNPREVGAQPCLLWDVEGTPRVLFRPGGSLAPAPCRPLFSLLQMGCLFVAIISRVTKNYIQSKKKKKKIQEKFPAPPPMDQSALLGLAVNSLYKA